ncbi:MAG: YjbH domain-containing protein [Syntrophorhabdaceae bacterium]|nr:YjbH domain-containing protein [Syntrophorhabdaceae bacterium]
MSKSFCGRLCLIALISLVNLTICFSILTPAHVCRAADEPFTGPSNSGGTGLMETPTARILKENRYRFGASQVHPYRVYYIGMGVLDRLEVNGRVTEILGVKASDAANWSGYGNYKDKAIDIKLQMAREQKYTPAIALGVMDPHGTRIFGSQYIVASKQVYPFDFSLGFGNGRFGKRPLPAEGEGFKAELFSDPTQWWKDSQLFGGIQFAPSDKFAFMVEYSPIKYEKQTNDPAQKEYFTRPVPSPFNFGVRWKPFQWSEVGVSYQRGDQIGVNFSMTFDIGNFIIPIYDKPYKEGQQDRNAPVCERVTRALSMSGFSDIVVYVGNGNTLNIEAQNDKYFYSTRAIGVILKLLSDILPRDVEGINIVLHRNGIPLLKFATTLPDIIDLQREKMELWEFYLVSRMDTKVSRLSGKTGKYKKFFDYGIKPDFKGFLNDPSGFFKYRAGVAGWLSYTPWKGATVLSELLAYPLNTVSTTNEPLSRPVRSDIVPYLEENLILSRLMFNQVYKTGKEVYAKFAAGILEVEYAGFDGEIAKPLNSGRFIVGLSGSVTKKRAVGKAFELKTNDVRDYYSTAFLNGRINIPEKELYIDVMAGQFLAGDKGVRVTVSKFIKGVTIFAWYSVTDTSIFKDSYNRGYHDKGVGISIPMNLFTGTDSRSTYSYAISPWTRDVAQDVDHAYNLFDYIGRDTRIYLDKDKKWMQ